MRDGKDQRESESSSQQYNAASHKERQRDHGEGQRTGVTIKEAKAVCQWHSIRLTPTYWIG